MMMTLGSSCADFRPWKPSDGRVFDFYAYDTETTLIDKERPYLTPTFVLGAAYNGERGFFITRDNIRAFFAAHRGVPCICHNAAFDLKVTNPLLQPETDLYEAVESNRVWDTMILKRVYTLATLGHTARKRDEASLATCAAEHLGINLDKGQQDADGNTVRTGFDQFLGKPPSSIPTEYLTYLAHDTIATWQLFWQLKKLIKDALDNAHCVFGYVDDDWLRACINRFGPLTHHVQLKASIVTDVLRSNGIGIDWERTQEKAAKVEAVMREARERMRRRGFLIGETGWQKALQSILNELKRNNPELALNRTKTGKAWSTTEEDLAELMEADEFFKDYAVYKQCEKLLSTYLLKMGKPRLYPKFGFLLETGRTNCGGGFNLQNLPREKGEKAAASTVRGCFVPSEGGIFIDCDFSQIELLVLAYAFEAQFGKRSALAEHINSGQDVHRLIASKMLDKPAEQVTKEERNSIKPVSFGRPGGMGVGGLQKVAKSSYGIELAPEQVQQRIDAYHQLCPELDAFLSDEIDTGLVIAESLGLTLAKYRQACGKYCDPHDSEANRPVGWLGLMLLKTLKDDPPRTQSGRQYTEEEKNFFWEQAHRLPIKLDKPDLRFKLDQRTPDRALWEAIRNWAGRRSVFTLTGRHRANTTFCSSRNTIFQGPAADGAILALWKVWRAGYKLVDFVHDQLVVEAPADDKVFDRVAHIEDLMKEGMLEVVPGMLVKVETVVTRSLNKQDLDQRYAEAPEKKEVAREPALAPS